MKSSILLIILSLFSPPGYSYICNEELPFEELNQLVKKLAEDSGWKQPALTCLEDHLPETNDPKACPKEIGPAVDVNQLWGNFCLSQDVLNREALKPGSQDQSMIRIAWVMARRGVDREKKIKWIYKAAEKYNMPPQILYSVLFVESNVSDVGIIRDFENYSCGPGSLNIEQWCHWANKKSNAEKKTMTWPLSVNCDDLKPEYIRPVFNKTLPGTESIQFATIADVKRFSKIKDTDYNSLYPKLPPTVRQAIKSFVTHCADTGKSIEATASMLKDIYDESIPGQLKKIEQYGPGESFKSGCKYPNKSNTYPLSSGWLLAYGVHNIGEEAVDLFKHYFSSQDGVNYNWQKNFTPEVLLEAIYNSGKYSEAKKKIIYTAADGSQNKVKKEISYFWPCNAQRNIAHLIGVLGYSSAITEDCPEDGTLDVSTRKASSGVYSK